jgi:hypothetical protein
MEAVSGGRGEENLLYSSSLQRIFQGAKKSYDLCNYIFLKKGEFIIFFVFFLK